MNFTEGDLNDTGRGGRIPGFNWCRILTRFQLLCGLFCLVGVPLSRDEVSPLSRFRKNRDLPNRRKEREGAVRSHGRAGGRRRGEQ